MKKNKVNPHIIIQIIQENFKDVLTKPNIKNLGLISIATTQHKKTIDLVVLIVYY